MTKRALALSGGGAKGAFQIGVLEELILNRGMDFEVLCGISVGALSASFLASAPFDPADPTTSQANLAARFVELRQLWLDEITGNSSIYRSRPGGMAGILGGADSLYSPSPLERLVQRHIDPEAVENSGRTLNIQYVALEDGVLRLALGTSETLRAHVMASATMPFLFPPVEVAGKHLVDGGLRDITPLGRAFEAKPDQVVAVYASPFEIGPAEFRDPWPGLRINAFDFLARTIEVLTSEIYMNDIEGARETNQLKSAWENVKARAGLDPTDPAVAAIEEILGPRHAAELIEFIPTEDPVGDALNFKPSAIRAAYEHGKAVASNMQ